VQNGTIPVIKTQKMRQKLICQHSIYVSRVDALLHEMASMQPEQYQQKPADGGWTAIQTAWHLMLVEASSLQYVHKKLAYGGTFEKAGFKAAWQILLLRVILKLPIKFKAPAATSGDQLPENPSFEELHARWKKAQEDWAQFFATMPEDLLDKAVFRHPRIGRINWMQTLDFLDSHFDRHLGQIQRAIR
jgi:hypothetical protein